MDTGSQILDLRLSDALIVYATDSSAADLQTFDGQYISWCYSGEPLQCVLDPMLHLEYPSSIF